jgi:tetratricopeptide (TPR) repeat protein
MSIYNLGIVLSDKGDYDGAEVIYRRALERYEKALGAEHSDTLASVCNLGHILSRKGDYEGAEALYRRGLDGREKALGTEDPDTILVAYGLAGTLNRLHRRPEAVSLLRRFAALSNDSRDAVAYNLACYECLEGNDEEAKRLISEHLKLHPEKTEQALADQDFAAIRDWIKAL